MTLFQRIINREIPARIEHEDKRCIVIHDIDPQAPIHLLVVPKELIPRVAEATEDDASLLGHLLLTAAMVADKMSLEGATVLLSIMGKMAARRCRTCTCMCLVVVP